ncbi:hypothetical protein EYZ11_010182 [Aspergillus tanneri]|uniref:Zn(2)-C6 fungal-type domain-containing protein n=1 Tax=Aspergillus tanneri TaxID=1220188 RepID=A0A4S3J838_9EURO|nr:uncharacterized protein ATNIH1004_003770 [Aspergillus tanneri]KAA8651077.1 hypothetical protein ATNIH1004_003770 [Aspergillus tanneri]THC90358.1 hypothetical protein EYZ11_010182 [Aspergillus tanneri]
MSPTPSSLSPPYQLPHPKFRPLSQQDVHTSWERLRRSCDACQIAKVKCSQHKPSCHRCIRHGQPCVYSPQRRTGRPRKKASQKHDPPEAINNNDPDVTAVSTDPRAQATGASFPGTPDLVMADVADDPQFLPMGPQGNGVDGRDGFMQPSLEALLEASLPNSGGGNKPSGSPGIIARPLPTHDQNNNPYNPPANDDIHNLISNTSPHALGDWSLFIHDFDLPVVMPSSSQVLDLDQIPALDMGTSSSSSECGDCGARCYTILLRQLLFLRQSIPESNRPSIDVILQVERQVRTLLDRIVGCVSCLSNRSSVLLLSVITERVVQMLDWIIEEKTLLDTENARSTRRALGTHALAAGSGVERKHVCRIPLRVGELLMDEDSKQYFLKHLILMRMKDLAAKMQDTRRTTATRPNDCIYRSADLVMVESLNRLDYLRGQVRLWE